MGTFTILSKRSNNSYSFKDSTDENLEKAYTALAGVQYELKHLSEGTIESTPEGTGADVTLEN